LDRFEYVIGLDYAWGPAPDSVRSEACSGGSSSKSRIFACYSSLEPAKSSIQRNLNGALRPIVPLENEFEVDTQDYRTADEWPRCKEEHHCATAMDKHLSESVVKTCFSLLERP